MNKKTIQLARRALETEILADIIYRYLAEITRSPELKKKLFRPGGDGKRTRGILDRIPGKTGGKHRDHKAGCLPHLVP
jgi:hypothetical protein